MRVLREGVDVVVVGGGIIGAACAEALSRRGVRVLVLDRGPLAGATTARGEGRLLVSDKAPGAGLALARAALRRWPVLLAALREEIGSRAACEFAPQGGLVVATREAEATALRDLAAAQRAAGVTAVDLTPEEAAGYEPRLTPAVRAAVRYPEDARLQPVLAATALLAAVRARGGEVRSGVGVLGVETGADGWVVGVRTAQGQVPCVAVVNACGTGAAALARQARVPLPVPSRPATTLVTAPLPLGTVRHQVSGAGPAPVSVGPSPAGPVLIGRTGPVPRGGVPRAEVLAGLARGATALFPALADVPVLRVHDGLCACTRDRLPVIGEDPRRPGLWHATGHAGAGAGLAAATGELLAQLFTGEPPLLDPRPYRVDRPGLGEEDGCP
ncbi:hypothetical protein BLA24_16130 [Streptomyces cinnamoneus]|uniref:FAD dependent oxidoreductase domain-containing protein n=1 Tax=Streptomyces cinnamoneus TaxID=53446 RepID=A0A2G1XJ72_STRCJ|nr:FAD-binding oxidoreductase [Streptomyces cinnamoneus]PHQ51273.1 hypothetical protein BLA24_16130 [Streptomyces cinnamoneus]PPT16505.1 FAD-binding oxidoreductase [Streptomyces cinnamoneus]